jgi:hypothetical protein
VGKDNEGMVTAPLRRGGTVRPYSAGCGPVRTTTRPGANDGPRKLGDLLTERGLVDGDQLRDALLTQSVNGQRWR